MTEKFENNNINKDDLIETEIKEHIKKNKHLDKNHLTEWKRVDINIAIVGDDKSNLTRKLLINKMIGSYQTQTGKHDIEMVDVTMKPTLTKPESFAHSNNDKFQVWDLGTINDLDKETLNSILSNKDFENELEKYDFFILLTKQSENLTENENLFADKIESLKKKIYFVKSIEDKNIQEAKIDEKEDVKTNETNPSDNKKPVYLLACDDSKINCQFIKLNDDILKDLEKNEKLVTYVLTIEPLSHQIIYKKTEILRTRAYQIAILSSIFGYFLPLPGLTIAADLTLLATEIIFYIKQFSLNKESIENLAKKFKGTHLELSKIFAKSKYASLLLLEDIHTLSGLLLKTIPLFAISSASDLFKFIPIMGFILKGTISYESTKYTLMSILDELSKVAIDVHNFIKDQNTMEKKYAHLFEGSNKNRPS